MVFLQLKFIVGSGIEGQGYGTDVEISSFCDLSLCNVYVASTVGWMKFVPRNASDLYSLLVRIRGEHFDPILEVFPLLERNFTQYEAKKKCDYVKKHLMDAEKKLLILSATKRWLEDPAA